MPSVDVNIRPNSSQTMSPSRTSNSERLLEGRISSQASPSPIPGPSGIQKQRQNSGINRPERVIPPVTLGRVHTVVKQTNSSIQLQTVNVSNSDVELTPPPRDTRLRNKSTRSDGSIGTGTGGTGTLQSISSQSITGTVRRLESDEKACNKRIIDYDPDLKELKKQKLQLEIEAIQSQNDFNARMRPLELKLKEAQVQLTKSENELAQLRIEDGFLSVFLKISIIFILIFYC